MQQTQSPLLRLWQLGKDHHGGLIAAIFCAVAGVLLGLLPYLSAGRILVALLTGQRDWNFYLLWCMVALGGYLAKTLLLSDSRHANYFEYVIQMHMPKQAFCQFFRVCNP